MKSKFIIIYLIASLYFIWSKSNHLQLRMIDNQSSYLVLPEISLFKNLETNKKYALRVCTKKTNHNDKPEFNIFYLTHKLEFQESESCFQLINSEKKEVFLNKNDWQKFLLENRIKVIENLPESPQKDILVSFKKDDFPIIIFGKRKSFPELFIFLVNQYPSEKKLLYSVKNKNQEKAMSGIHHFLMNQFLWIIAFEFILLIILLGIYSILNNRKIEKNTSSDWKKYSYTLRKKEKIKIKSQNNPFSGNLEKLPSMSINWKKDILKIKIKNSENREIDLKSFEKNIKIDLSSDYQLELEPYIIADSESNSKKLSKIIVNLYSSESDSLE